MIGQTIRGLGPIARERGVPAASAVALLPAAAGLHAIGLTSNLNAAHLSVELLQTQLWITLGVTAVFGALGGVVAELISLHGRIELPHRVKKGSTCKRSRLADPRHEFDLGILSRLTIGATAAVAFLALPVPNDPTAFIANALIAGSASTAVFRLLRLALLGKSPAATPRSPRLDKTPSRLMVIGETQHAAAQ